MVKTVVSLRMLRIVDYFHMMAVVEIELERRMENSLEVSMNRHVDNAVVQQQYHLKSHIQQVCTQLEVPVLYRCHSDQYANSQNSVVVGEIHAPLCR